MVFFETSSPAKVGTKGATDDEKLAHEELASFSFSWLLSPKRWNKVGENNNENNELADVIIDEDDERLDKNAEAPKVEEEREAKETNEPEEVGRAAASDDSPTSGEACVSVENTKDREVTQVGDDADEKEDEVEVPVKEGAEVPAVTFAAKQKAAVASPASPLEVKVQKAEKARGVLLKALADRDVAAKSPKRALFDDDIPDDESEASIEVLFRYMGCTNQVYGEHPTISATMTMETTGTHYTAGTYYTYASGDASEFIEHIDTFQSVDDDVGDGLGSPTGKLLMEADDDDEANEPKDIDRGNEKKEIFNKELTPPDDQQDNATPPDEQLDDATPPVNKDEKKEIFNKKLTHPDDQPHDATPPDEQLGDITPPFEIIVKPSLNDGQIDESAPSDGKVDENAPISKEQVDEITPNDERSGDDIPIDGSRQERWTRWNKWISTDEQVLAVEENVTEEQTSSAEAKPVLNLLAVGTKPHESSNIHPPEDSRSAAINKVVSRLSHAALSPSVRKVALALQNAPKYPTTDYVDKNESGGEEKVCHSELPFALDQGNDTDKGTKTEDTPLEEQGEKEDPATSETLSKVDEMDKLIKSTRDWLEKQKAVRKAAEERKALKNVQTSEEKVMVNTADTSVSLKNTMNTALPEEKKLDTSLPVMKSPPSTKRAQPLSPRTLDTLLASRKAPSSDGPKKSILEQLEEIRKKQREREASSTPSS